MRIDAASPDDLDAVRTLVASSGLPLDGLGAHQPTLVLVARQGGRLVGTAALEGHGPDGLLRSVAVDPAARGQGVGSALTAAALADAGRQGMRAVYLLTDTVPGFFTRHGFDRTGRDGAPDGIAASVEWSEACGESAIAMVLALA